MKRTYIRPESTPVRMNLSSSFLTDENPSGFAGQSRVTVDGSTDTGGVVWGAKGYDMGEVDWEDEEDGQSFVGYQPWE